MPQLLESPPTPDRERSPTDIGRTIDHYVIEAPLGKGGMGLVYRARDMRLGRVVALKLLPPHGTLDPDRRRRFLQEARAACTVNHPALAQIYDVGEDHSDVFIAMELVDGRTVEALLQAHELDLPGALEVAIQIASGLQKAHEAGIIHRDLKPANVMVTPDGRAKLLDFGLAKRLDAAPSTPTPLTELTTLAKTQAGTIVGTVGYMSPEQARGLPIDHRSDIFAFGVLLYEMTTGRRPFSGATALDTLHAIAFEEAAPIAGVKPGVPASLDHIVTRCLKKSADDRYLDCNALVADLIAVRRDLDSGASRPRPVLDRVRDHLGFVGDWPARERLLIAMVAGFGVATAWLIFRGARPWDIVSIFVLALFAGRGLRHRRPRLARRFAGAARRIAEVRMVARDGSTLIVLTRGAMARTYVRLSALVESVNASMFVGDPFQLVVRDAASPEDELALLRTAIVLYSREEG